MRQALELAEAPATGEENYQTVDVSDPKHPHIANKPRRKRRLFWWLRGGYGKPRKLDQLDPIHRKFEFRRDFLKKLNVLFYPQVSITTYQFSMLCLSHDTQATDPSPQSPDSRIQELFESEEWK